MIYIIPDKVIVWIGGHAGSTAREIAEDLQTTQGALDKGGENLKKEASGVATGFSNVGEGMNAAITGNAKK